MIDYIENIDHIGYAVKNMENAREIFCSIGFELSENKLDKARAVNVSLGKWGCVGGIKLEILAPIDGIQSPIDGYLSKLGSTPYHICYKVSDINKSIFEFQKLGFTLLSYPAQSVPLGGDVCFMYSPIVGIIELIQY